jgi:hypothetical protein
MNIDIFITLVGGFILGYLLGVRVTRYRILTLLDRMKKEYFNGV